MGKYLPIIKVAECGSVNQAAQVMGYSPPSLTYIINNIEQELGTRLFFRTHQGTVLTENGRRLLEYMREIERLEDQLHQKAKDLGKKVLRVGIMPSISEQWTPYLLSEFYQDHPDVIVKLMQFSRYQDSISCLKEYNWDCTFFSGTCPPGMETIPLYVDRYLLVVSQDSKLAGLEEVSIEEAQKEVSFIPTAESYDEGSSIWTAYQSMTKIHNFDAELSENRTALTLVERGLGAAILSELQLTDSLANRPLRAIPLKGDFTRQISILCPKESLRPPLTSAFCQAAQRAVESWKRDLSRRREG